MSQPKKAKSRFVKSISPISTSEVGMANRGFSYIKRVTVDENGEEETSTDILPITTARLDGVRKKFSKDKAPRPPVRELWVSHESDEGRGMGLTKPQMCSVPNFADEVYVREHEEFSERIAWAMVAEALDVPLYTVDGNGQPLLATTTEEKISALRAAGFTTAQILQVMGDVGRISAFSEDERRSFFALNSASK